MTTSLNTKSGWGPTICTKVYIKALGNGLAAEAVIYDVKLARDGTIRPGTATTRFRNLNLDHARRAGLRGERAKRMSSARKEKERVCEICMRGPPQKRLVFDHNHATGKFRGILCKGCNLIIGMLRESPSAFERAIVYLSR